MPGSRVVPHPPGRRGDNLRVRFFLKCVACAGALSLVSLAACSGGGPAGKAGIEIGVDLPLSGADGQAGTPTLNGVRFFVHQHPVLDGFSVGVVSRDDAVRGVHDPKVGAQNMSNLIADPIVLGVIGPFNSSVARATIPVANQAHLAMISPSTSSPCLTKDAFLPAGLTDPTRRRSALAATFVAGLQLAKEGSVELRQAERFGPIYLRKRSEQR